MNSPAPTYQSQTKSERRAARLLERHLRAGARARVLFERSSRALDAAVEALGRPVGAETILHLRDGTPVKFVDQFAKGNAAFSAKMFHRYSARAPKVAKEAEVAA